MSACKVEDYRLLSPRYSIPFSSAAGDPSHFFPRTQPVILEIGFGMGQATVAIAERNPGTNYLGIEVHMPGVAAVLRKIDEHALDNLRIIQHDAAHVLQHMIPREVFHGVHIFFPDPWPKKRHFKRRLIQNDFLTVLSGRLKEGAYVYTVTDWKDYAAQIVDCFEASPCFVRKEEEKPWRPETSFERKGIERGHSIFEMYYIKQSPSENLPAHQSVNVPESVPEHRR